MKKILSVVLVLLSSSVFSQTCLETIGPSIDVDNFTDNNDGTVTDNRLGLTWMRCSLGQTWENSNCSGDAMVLNWQQALVAAHGYEYAGKNGWRVPNVKELASITERQCVRPAVNQYLFPNTPADDFWTSTPAIADQQRAWVIAFFNSSNSIKDKNAFVYTRLVRTAN